jgi:hypothetical protein
MNALLQLLIRHGLASLGGFFAAHQITGSSTSSIIVGLIVLAVPTVWSWLANLLRMEDIAPSTFDIGKNEILRTLIGSLVSQGITALSVYFATDANNPELLGVALVNAAASKFGLHQKALGMPGLKLLILSASALSVTSCSSLVPFMLRHEAEIETAIVYGVKLGTQAGFKKLRTSAKNPVPNVQPKSSSIEQPASSNDCLEPGPDAAPRCLKITGIPDYGVRVAAHLAAQ